MTLQIRHATHPEQLPGLDTAALRRHYLVDDLFVPGAVTAVLTHHDRIVLAGARPTEGPLTLGTYPELRSEFFLERREAGIVNVGEPGTVTADGTKYELTTGACLYVGRGVRDLVFEGPESAFYVFSAPAHTSFPTAQVNPGEGNRLELGDQQTANRRTIDQFIHADGVQSCQVVLGVTTLHAGSTWNTMPAHTHDRRTECYLYFGLPESERIVHLLGEPEETRHLLVADRQAIISPSWSIHSGCGTSSYSFVWAMAGENQAFGDMDGVDVRDLR
ncbi:5-dehydro-4-deoxy-D-glucuronate isomerase [Kribbella sp. VKM Ac-2566]|uniref:5-dehydro-4-deoxy-D-glucuronate isomerase n=1 Tax=Kribbella sp. VKM Ac-2566 TaxID=2512218 RepID=UPI0010EAEF34|nr:5-dehydro-4-deoxy-D-glucuronate isomerase [Kribbella sp. VKM Ac-2566]TDX03245.1 4-deoxy-L-threo-5-hexosulose-uronate ketol-isomerase [Kribbella sp. VKM Ac-2566]